MIQKKPSPEIFAEMCKAGLLYGCLKSQTHSGTKPFIVGNFNNIEIIDLEITLNHLNDLVSFLKDKIYPSKSEPALILLVGTTPPAIKEVKEFAQQYKFPYITNKWIAGTLTNFNQIRKRIDYYLEYKQKIEKGELKKYTKKERLKMEREFLKLKQNFESLVALSRLPDILFVVNPFQHKIAVCEANKMNIPVVGIVGTNFNLKRFAYPVLANDCSRESISWIFSYIRKNLKEGRKKRSKKKTESK